MGYGEPDSTIKYLINEPVTMLDWGLHRLNNILEKRELSAFDAAMAMNYDWETNRFKVIVAAAFKATTEPTAKSLCKNAIGEIKQSFFVDHETGKPMVAGFSNMGSFFSHSGFKTGETPVDVGRKLERITFVEVHVPLSQKGQKLVCRSDLLSTEVFFGE